MTLLNQHQWQQVEQLPSIGGDAAARSALILLVRREADFAAGFDRVAGPPAAVKDGFETDFVIDAEWRGGRKLLQVRVRAVQKDGAWHLAGFSVDPAQ